MLKKLSPYFSRSHLLPKFIVSLLLFTLLCTTLTYQTSQLGFALGSYITLLIWSLYILCIPVAHGRFFIGSLIRYFTGKRSFPELFVWAAAASINIFTVIFMPRVYQASMLTFFLYRILITPRYWTILLTTLLAAWYRRMAHTNFTSFSDNIHSLIRHLIFIGGSFLFFYLTHQEFIIILNISARR